MVFRSGLYLAAVIDSTWIVLVLASSAPTTVTFCPGSTYSGDPARDGSFLTNRFSGALRSSGPRRRTLLIRNCQPPLARGQISVGVGAGTKSQVSNLRTKNETIHLMTKIRLRVVQSHKRGQIGRDNIRRVFAQMLQQLFSAFPAVPGDTSRRVASRVITVGAHVLGCGQHPERGESILTARAGLGAALPRREYKQVRVLLSKVLPDWGTEDVRPWRLHLRSYCISKRPLIYKLDK